MWQDRRDPGGPTEHARNDWKNKFVLLEKGIRDGHLTRTTAQIWRRQPANGRKPVSECHHWTEIEALESDAFRRLFCRMGETGEEQRE